MVGGGRLQGVRAWEALEAHRTHSFPSLSWAEMGVEGVGGGLPWEPGAGRPQVVQDLFCTAFLRFEEVTILPVPSLTQEPLSHRGTGVGDWQLASLSW